MTEWPSHRLINMWMKTMCDKLNCLLAAQLWKKHASLGALVASLQAWSNADLSDSAHLTHSSFNAL